MAHETLVHALTASARTREGFVFVDGREAETPLSFKTLEDRAARAATVLKDRGVKPGDCVAIILPTGPTFFDALLGCQRLGAVPVPLYPPVRLGRLDEYVDKTVAMLNAVRAVALISDKRVRRILGRVVEQRPTPSISVEELLTGTPYDGPLPSADDLAMVQFSSGTTVAPKPVALTHRQVIANVDAILSFVPTNDGVRRVGAFWLPLYHDMGLVGCVFSAIVAAGTLILIPPEQFLAKPHLWLRAISRHNVTTSPAPNFAYALCTERITDEQMDGVDLSTWALALNGAEPVAPASLRAFTQRFAQWGLSENALTPVYGLAEAALAVTFSDPRAPFTTVHVHRDALASGHDIVPIPAGDITVELASVGTPLPGFAIRVCNSAGDNVDDGTVGRVFASGPSLMQGYLHRDEQPIQAGWLDTGDLGIVLGGDLFITGRAKDVVVLRGQNHAPHDIERAVDGIEGVRTGCAVAVGDVSEAGERLMVFVEARIPTDDLAAACHSAIRSRTGLEPSLVTILEPGTIPRTSSGKLRRGETLRRFHAGTLAPPASVSAWRMAGHLARSAVGWARSRRS
jgi:fatty-acyl-CoA synthase